MKALAMRETPKPPPRALPCLWVLALAVAGCGRTVTEADCTQIKDNMRTAWQAEAKKATSTDAAAAERANAVIRSEGDKLVNDWMSECKRELMGRRVDPKEMSCLLAARTIDDINKCSD